MKRREFITLLCGAAAAWPFAARAQESRQVRLVGIFYNYGRADDPVTTAEIGAFKEALWRLGWSEGRNVRFEEHLNPPRFRDQAQACQGTRRYQARRDPHVIHSGDNGRFCRDPHNSGRVRERIRPGWKRFCSESLASGRKRNGIHQF